MTRRFHEDVEKFPSWDRLLEQGALSMGLKLETSAIRKFYSFAVLLQKWGRRINLTSKLEPEEIISLHFLDSLSLLATINPDTYSTLVDIGSGAGFPGIPLKIARPDLAVTLLESSGRKTAFCSAVIDQLGLNNIKIARTRAEKPDEGLISHGVFDLAVSRAVAPLPKLLRFAEDLLKNGGMLAAYKGPAEDIPRPVPANSLPGWSNTWKSVVSVPGRPTARAILFFKKL